MTVFIGQCKACGRRGSLVELTDPTSALGRVLNLHTYPKEFVCHFCWDALRERVWTKIVERHFSDPKIRPLCCLKERYPA